MKNTIFVFLLIKKQKIFKTNKNFMHYLFTIFIKICIKRIISQILLRRVHSEKNNFIFLHVMFSTN
jgi:cell shape-determining protein MreD